MAKADPDLRSSETSTRANAVGSLAWLAIGVLVAALALPRFLSGLKSEAAVPVPMYMIIGYTLPHQAYIDAAEFLVQTDAADGFSHGAAAEALADAAANPAAVIALAQQSVRAAPASGRVWCILANQEYLKKNMKAAAAAFSTALTLGPFDYNVAGCRARVGSKLWPYLSEGVRQDTLAQARLLWEEPALRDQISQLIDTNDGRNLMTRALAGQPREIGKLNRWIFIKSHNLQVRMQF